MTVASKTLATVALAAALIGGCKGEQAPAQDQPAAAQPAAAEQPAPNPELAVAMTEHFARASALEQAVIDGDLEAVASHAKWLVDELPAKQLPATWQPSLARMQAAAGEAAKAEDLAGAAAATGAVIQSCGACHLAVGAGPTFAAATPVPEGEDSKSRMLRHQWAAERMREGMIGPSDERWQLGAGAVSVAPPEPCPIENAEILADDVLKLRERIYELGAEAAKTPAGPERARVYGEYLSTCAGCHTGAC